MGEYRCDCTLSFILEPGGHTLPNGAVGETCSGCEWYSHHCSSTLVYIAVAVMIVLVLWCSWWKQGSKG